MKIETGLFDKMVLQRGGRNVSDALITGKASGNGRVLAKVSSGGKALRGFASIKVGQCSRGRFTARLKGVPVGGPYDVELWIQPAGKKPGRDCQSIGARDVLVGDVWLLGGQSNMQGCGLIRDALKPVKNVRAFYMDDTWDVAKEPLHTLACAVDPVHGGDPQIKRKTLKPIAGVSPGLGFGQEMLSRTDIPQGLIACAHGGTSMTQWDPALKKKGGASLYGAMIRRLKKNGGKVAGLLWYQGCSDCGAEPSELYTKRMLKLVSCVRRDCADRNLPVAVVQISRVVDRPDSTAGYWNSVQDQQRLLQNRIRRCAVVPAIDLCLDDLIHISGKSQNRLGRRLAQAVLALRKHRGSGSLPIELKSVSTGIGTHGLCDVIVEFKNVAGKLRSGDRPVGFTLASDGKPLSLIHDTVLDRNRAVLRTPRPPEDIKGLDLHYGLGYDPVCNITDELDRSVPVLGPIWIPGLRTMTMFAEKAMVSNLMPFKGKFKNISCSSAKKARFKKREFSDGFFNMRDEIGKTEQDRVIFFRFGFECSRAMRLRGIMGYDGPLKVWLDGKQVFVDATAANPAGRDKGRFSMRAGKGRHDLVAALCTNGGRAWGLCLRLERLDTAKWNKQSKKPLPLPEWLG